MPQPDGPPEDWRHDARVLRALAAAAAMRDKPLRVLEIGTWMGASAIIWAHAIQELCGGRGCITCVDTWQPYGEEPAPFERFAQNIANAQVEHLIEVRRGRSDAVLPTLAAASYDLVYIDGDHSYAGARSDVESAKRLPRAGGILCGDDLEVLFQDCNQYLALKWAETDSEYEIDPMTRRWFHPGVTVAVYECLGPVWHVGQTWAVRKTADGWSTAIDA